MTPLEQYRRLVDSLVYLRRSSPGEVTPAEVDVAEELHRLRERYGFGPSFGELLESRYPDEPAFVGT